MKRVAIVGSREWRTPGIAEEVREYVRTRLEPDDVMVSGHGGVVDINAEEEAKRQQIAYMIFPAQWDRYGRKAGPIRNQLIVENCDRLVAWWDGESKGTKDAIDRADKAGIGLTVYTRKTQKDHPATDGQGS